MSEGRQHNTVAKTSTLALGIKNNSNPVQQNSINKINCLF